MTLLQELTEIQVSTALRSDYLKSLALLRALKAGTVQLADFEMLKDGWQLIDRPPIPPPVEKPPSEA